MNNLKGYDQWLELFDETVSKVWSDEPNPGLKNISMMYFCISKEMKKFQDTFQIDFQCLKTATSQSYKMKKSPVEQLTTFSETDSPKKRSQNESGSTIISDDDLKSAASSPEIRTRNSTRRTIKQRSKLKRKLNINNNPETMLKDIKNLPMLNINIVPQANDVLKSPNDSPARIDEDSSIILGTPLALSAINPDKVSTFLRKRVAKNDRSLTQMFYTDTDNPEKLKKQSQNDFERISSSPGNNQSGESLMGITSMLNYMDKLESNKTTENSLADMTKIGLSFQVEEFEESTSLNSAILEENVQSSNEDSLNEFLAKKQNVSRQLEADPVVRGKKRQNLPCWSCKDCDKFYLKQGFNTDKLLKLTKCSKHRGLHKPREETLPGFWDMDLVTQNSMQK